MEHVSKTVATRVCTIRHDETDWNIEKSIQGHPDTPLNEHGRLQAMAMVFNAAHHHFQAIYKRSGVNRGNSEAPDTARGSGRDLLPQLRERHFGVSGHEQTRGFCDRGRGRLAWLAVPVIAPAA